MRRRPKDDDVVTPDRLRAYDPDDWPTGCHPECEYWRAVDEWHQRNPGEWCEFDFTGPDTPFHPELI